MSRRVIEILRVSTNQQDIRRQRTDLQRNKAKFDLEVIRALELVGQSGTTVLTNKQVQQVLSDLASRGVDGVSISAIDRLFRPKNFDDFVLLGHFQRQGKCIWSTREGFVDPSTDHGYKTAADAAVEAEHERRRLLQRTWDGKEELRKEGRCANGPNTLPRGVAYDKATGKWGYLEPDCLDVARMFPQLLAGDSYLALESKFPDWSFEGIRRTLRNVIWIGLRKFPATGRREEAYTRKVISEPLVSEDMFWAVQREMDRRGTEWSKTHSSVSHTLAPLLRHSCGRKFYVHSAGKKGGPSYYSCSSTASRRGPKCAPSGINYRMDVIDAVVYRLVGETLCQTAVLRSILGSILERQPQHEEGRVAAQREVSRLEKRRVRVLDMYERGDVGREEYIKRLGEVDRALSSARAVAAKEPPPVTDVHALVRGLAGAFARFSSLSAAEKWGLLRRAVRDIILDGPTIPSITLRGGFLGEILEAETGVVNLSTHTRPPSIT